MLAAPHKRKECLHMTRQAMKDQAPKMYRQLKEAKKLKESPNDHEEQMIQSYLDARHEAQAPLYGKDEPKDFLTKVQKLTEAENRAWSDTLEMYLSFSDPEV